MSKILRITNQEKENLREQFEKFLAEIKITSGKATFSPTLPGADRKAKLYFSEVAWLKMQTLIKEFDKEVAWHGVAFRSEEDNDDYYITDIVVYPQEVTGATVNTDQEKYQSWLMELDDDTFNNMRMQGHSHVNMSTSPSQVDITHQEALLSQVSDDMFYIFVIWNKKGEKTIKIYDFLKNILFETSDITVEIMNGDLGLSEFIANAKERVKDKVYTPPAYTPPANKNLPSSTTTPATGTQNDKNTGQKNDKKSRKGKRKQHKTGTVLKMNNACDVKSQTYYNSYDDPYFDSYDPYYD